MTNGLLDTVLLFEGEKITPKHVWSTRP